MKKKHNKKKEEDEDEEREEEEKEEGEEKEEKEEKEEEEEKEEHIKLMVVIINSFERRFNNQTVWKPLQLHVFVFSLHTSGRDIRDGAFLLSRAKRHLWFPQIMRWFIAGDPGSPVYVLSLVYPVRWHRVHSGFVGSTFDWFPLLT